MARMIVLHALVKWKDGASRRTAYRGETVELGGAELKRLSALGAVVRPKDFPADDEPVPGQLTPPVDAAAADTAGPLVDRDAVAAAVLRRRLDLPDDTPDDVVLSTLDERLAASTTGTGGVVVVGDPPDAPEQADPGGDDPAAVEPDDRVESDEQRPPQGAQYVRPAQSAPKSEWEQYAVDTQTYTADEAGRKSKQQLIANTPVPS